MPDDANTLMLKLILQRLDALEEKIDKLDERVRTVEMQLPALVELRKWMARGILGFITMAVTAVAGTIFVKH